MLLQTFALLSLTARAAIAQSSQSGTQTSSASTAIPSSTQPADTVIKEQRAPALQSWCTDPIYCAGDILQTVELAEIFPDSKTFPDKPTRYSINETVSAWNALQGSNNLTIGALEAFVSDYFKGEGTELVPVSIREGFNASSTPFLSQLSDRPIVSGWVAEVISYWSDLIRETNTSAVCNGITCDSSLIPLNNTVVVPGGRYREVYYWDTYFIILGLLDSGLSEYARDSLMNFMDQIETYGFIPNGGRTYYLNRSQPPLFISMLSAYVNATNDTSILDRALPLADVELNWWSTNRTFSVTSPYTNKTYNNIARYDVFLNTAPRPEGYVEDYNTVNLASPSLNETEAENLYRELASGAESGWDYSSRFMKDRVGNASDPLQGLRTLNIRAIAPVDLNAILTANHYILADLYDGASANGSSTSNYTSRASLHRSQGDDMKTAMLDLMWDSDKLAFYDFNTTANARSDFFSLAGYYPFWLNIFPPELETDETKMFGAFAGLHAILDRYNGSVPCTLNEPASPLNWDFPNAWPPHQYILASALSNVASNVSSTPYSTIVPSNASSFSLVPTGQFGLDEGLLPSQPGLFNVLGGNSAANHSVLHNVVRDLNGSSTDESWRSVLLTEVVNRYISSAFCSWYSTGGSLPGVLSQLPAAELNVTSSTTSNTGNMFEKFNATDVDAAGGGGEYAVVVGFGWTNGVVIRFAKEYADVIRTPVCPAIIVESAPVNSSFALAGFRVKVGE